MKSVFVCLALALSSAVSFGASADAPKVQATLLDHSEYLCKNCLFGMSDYYFCFNANDKILVGYERVRTQIRKPAPENLIASAGKMVPIRFDEKYIWVPGPRGKDVRLTQDYSKQLFLFSDQCKRAVRK